MKTVIAKGKTVEEAIENALKELDTTIDRVTTRVIDVPGSGILGMFSNRYAKVELTVNDDEKDILETFLSDVFEAMQVDVDINASYEDEMLVANLESDDTGVLIGRRGQTLDALQYLTGLIVNKNKDEYTRVCLDVGNYREKRKKALQDLADRIASNVQRRRGKHVLEPMNPYERRIIHSALQNYKNIVTYSEGEEPYRHVIIEYKREQI